MRLTKRELDVLKLLTLPRKVIQKKLWISNSTVCIHTLSIYSKLCAHNRAEALVKALKKGLITLEEIETE